MIGLACAGRRPLILGPPSPLSSLAWTSPRTPNCRPASAGARRADCLSFDVLRRRPKGVGHGNHYSSLCLAGRPQGVDRSLCATDGARQSLASGDPPLGNDDAGSVGVADWMAAEGVTDVGMESTGVFWKPVYNILEGRFKVLLINARHLKQVPGRKTDVSDCQ